MSETTTATLLQRVTCPHCWTQFSPADALWVSQHPDLLNDPRLGADFQQRFLPSRFTVSGAALDAKGFECHGLACPRCHLEVPRALFEMQPIFLSILGAPSSGKSYFLASMTWKLRSSLPKYFKLSFGDADTEFNRFLNEYEEVQFLNPDQDKLVALRKTEEQGDMFNTVLLGGERIMFPRPFVFGLRPMEAHPHANRQQKFARTLCVYDNAGENFLPGKDTAATPVTRHLALSRALFFLFDPTQDLRFRTACQGKTQDPQMAQRTNRLSREWSGRQDTLLHEAAARIRRFAGLGQNSKFNRPLIMVITKYDAWKSLLPGQKLDPPWTKGRAGSLCGLDLNRVNHLSSLTRRLLREFCPEIVAAAEGFADTVVYVPISAIGRPPEIDSETGALGVRPRDIKPIWAEVPLLYTLSRWVPGLIPHLKSSSSTRLKAFPEDSEPDHKERRA